MIRSFLLFILFLAVKLPKFKYSKSFDFGKLLVPFRFKILATVHFYVRSHYGSGLNLETILIFFKLNIFKVLIGQKFYYRIRLGFIAIIFLIYVICNRFSSRSNENWCKVKQNANTSFKDDSDPEIVSCKRPDTNKIRVLCVIFTTKQHHATKLKAVHATWSKRLVLYNFVYNLILQPN